MLFQIFSGDKASLANHFNSFVFRKYSCIWRALILFWNYINPFIFVFHWTESHKSSFPIRFILCLLNQIVDLRMLMFQIKHLLSLCVFCNSFIWICSSPHLKDTCGATKFKQSQTKPNENESDCIALPGIWRRKALMLALVSTESLPGEPGNYCIGVNI